jgi:hypothetical protein
VVDTIREHEMAILNSLVGAGSFCCHVTLQGAADMTGLCGLRNPSARSDVHCTSVIWHVTAGTCASTCAPKKRHSNFACNLYRPCGRCCHTAR